MSYWSHNVELYDEIIYQEARIRAELGRILSTPEMIDDAYEDGCLVPWLEERHGWDILYDIMITAEREYWGGLIDDIMTRRKY